VNPAELRRIERYRDRRIPQRVAALRPTVPAPRRKPRERGNGLVKRHGITETASCRAQQHQESRQSSEKKTDYLASPQENPHGVG
jgi:hypothetical protein